MALYKLQPASSISRGKVDIVSETDNLIYKIPALCVYHYTIFNN